MPKAGKMPGLKLLPYTLFQHILGYNIALPSLPREANNVDLN
jgi:hypothetical protein